jgi:hypothetical protein
MNQSLRDTGMPIVAVTTRGARSGKLRKNPDDALPTAACLASSPPSGSDEHRASKSRPHRQLTRTNAGAATRQTGFRR